MMEYSFGRLMTLEDDYKMLLPEDVCLSTAHNSMLVVMDTR